MISASSSAWPRRLLAISWKSSALSRPAKERHSSKPCRALSAALSRSSREEVANSSMLSSVAGFITSRWPSCVMPLGFLPARQDSAAAEDQDHRRGYHHGRERVDDGADAELDHGVDLQGQRARPDPRDEERYHEVVEGEREREERAGHDARQNQRKRYPQEGLDGARPEVLGRLLDGAVHPREP